MKAGSEPFNKSRLQCKAIGWSLQLSWSYPCGSRQHTTLECRPHYLSKPISYRLTFSLLYFSALLIPATSSRAIYSFPWRWRQ